MFEMEKLKANQILETLNKLTEAKGPEFTEGLIAGINLGTSRTVVEEERPA